MRIGVIGAGQLGRMLALAGFPLALGFRFLDARADSPGGQIAPIVTGAFDDPDCIARLSAACDVVTYEFENVPVTALAQIPASVPCHPPLEALRVSQDRLYEKELFGRLGIATPSFRAVDTLAELEAAASAIGLPAVLKTRRLGYDGRGQRYLRRTADLAPAFTALGGVPLILEGFVRFEREVSIVGARSTKGEIRVYPLAENVHGDGILRTTRAPLNRPRVAARGGTPSEAVIRSLRLRGCAHDRVLRPARAAGGERDGAARAQLRPLDHRGRGYLAVRESPASDSGMATGQHPGARTRGDGQPDRHDAGP